MQERQASGVYLAPDPLSKSRADVDNHCSDVWQGREGSLAAESANPHSGKSSDIARGCLRHGITLLAAIAALAQVPPPQAPLLRGILLERDSEIDSGEFSVRGPQNEVVRYRFDSKTRVERGVIVTAVPHLQSGEEVEVMSEPIPESPLRYARTVLAAEPKPAPPRMVSHQMTRAGAPAARAALPARRRDIFRRDCLCE